MLLLGFAPLDGLSHRFGTLFYAECVLLLVLFVLLAAHRGYFGRKLASFAEAEQGTQSPVAAASFADRRRELQRISRRSPGLVSRSARRSWSSP